MNIMPLLLGLTMSADEEQAVLDFVLRDIMVKHKNHISSGIVGVRSVFNGRILISYSGILISYSGILISYWKMLII